MSAEDKKEEKKEKKSRHAESKREEFRMYLEKSGVLDTLTKVLVTLYEEPEKPSSAIDFLKSNIGAEDNEGGSDEVAKLKERIEELELENKQLKEKLAETEDTKKT